MNAREKQQPTPNGENRRAPAPYGLLGEKLGHSYSPQIHERFGDYRYDLFEVPPQELGSFLQARRFRGLNVTIPYKRAVMPYLDVVDDRAAAIGAVNTLYFRDGQLHGTNTDYDGFLYLADRAGISFDGRTVLIAGTGGAGRMVQKAAADRGAARVLVAGRRGPVRYEELPRLGGDIDLLVNATPLGTWPHNGSQAVDLAVLPHLKGVLDLVYNPAKTALLLQAEERGIPAASGLAMLVAQAAAAACCFTERTDYPQQIEAIVHELERDARNITLVGMPGSGKTTVGRALAEALSMTFVDSDEELAARCGCSAGQFLREHGEAAFRRLESRVLADLTAAHGQVIATGGGAVLRPENRRAMRQNGPVIFLRRPLEQLETAGRPLSSGREALEKMYKKRLPLYQSCSDFAIDNDGPLTATLAAVRAILR
ncbi:MAG: shikimate kinase [Anaerovoracaceae bacterium]|jgi:shikimate dehydrogenase